MLNTTMQSTKSGGPLAGGLGGRPHASATSGYAATSPGRCVEATTAIVAGVDGIAGAARASPRPTRPWSRSRPTSSCDAFTICDEMAARGLVRPAADVVRRAAADHPPLGERGDARARRRVPRRRWATSVAAAVAAGPVASTPASLAFIEALDPAALVRRGLRRPARRRRPVGDAAATGLAAPRTDGRGQRAARPGLTADARGPAGRLPRPAAAPHPPLPRRGGRNGDAKWEKWSPEVGEMATVGAPV